MRINKYLALATGVSRRQADQLVRDGQVTIDGKLAELGQDVTDRQSISQDGKQLKLPASTQTIILNKPAGYVCSRDGQGSQTIYDLLPVEYHHLKPVGRLDKDSSGLLVLTNDGRLAHDLTHPSNQKLKIYRITLDKDLADHDKLQIENGVTLEDGPSKLALQKLSDLDWQVRMHEGRNRQIRRTFNALGYAVTKLHRQQFGEFKLGSLELGSFKTT